MKKHHEGMIDNRHVSGNHQGGIERVKQRKGDMQKGQGGHMHKEAHGDWKVPNSASTPRKA